MEAVKPKSLKEALDIIDKKDVYILNGGTDIMVKKKNESSLIPKFDKDVMLISDMSEIKNIYADSSYIHIGSGCTYSEIIKSEKLDNILKEPAKNIASPAIRNVATIGGNICNSSPAGDILPALYALDAKIVVDSAKNKKIIPIEDFIKGPSRNILYKNELITEIMIPVYDFNKTCYKKVGTRKSTAISKLSFYGLANVKNNKILDIRMSFGAVGPTIVRSKDIENEIKKLTKNKVINNVDNFLNMYEKIINPIDDQRSNANYRKTVCLNLVECFLKAL